MDVRLNILLAGAGLAPLDWAIVAAYAAAVMTLAVLFFKRQNTTGEYFLAGRSMPWWAVGLSLYASMFSSYSFVGCP